MVQGAINQLNVLQQEYLPKSLWLFKNKDMRLSSTLSPNDFIVSMQHGLKKETSKFELILSKGYTLNA